MTRRKLSTLFFFSWRACRSFTSYNSGRDHVCGGGGAPMCGNPQKKSRAPAGHTWFVHCRKNQIWTHAYICLLAEKRINIWRSHPLSLFFSYCKSRQAHSSISYHTFLLYISLSTHIPNQTSRNQNNNRLVKWLYLYWSLPAGESMQVSRKPAIQWQNESECQVVPWFFSTSWSLSVIARFSTLSIGL